MDNTYIGSGTLSATPDKVVPLLASLNRAEELTSAIVVRLDPITNHVPINDAPKATSPTVTGRLHSLGDALQYLLDNIEL